MDPHIFADPDPGSQNLADPTDLGPDPKDCGIVCRNENGTDKLNEFCFALPKLRPNLMNREN